MNYVEIPINIKKVKTAILGNFSLRECIFLALGFVFGGLFFYYSYEFNLGINIAIYGMFGIGGLFFFLGFYKKREKYLEKLFFYKLNFRLSKRKRLKKVK